MRVHWLQHAEHEGLGCIEPWLRARGYALGHTRLHAGEPLPGVRDFDWLIAMGGPMNVDEHDRYPWLVAEKALLTEACAAGRIVLGICLGGQLLARVLGAKVTRNAEREIGWFEVSVTEEGRQSPLLRDFPDKFATFHWHEDTFAIPPGCHNLMKSDACVNQGFVAGDRVVALQFHPELQLEDARRWLAGDAPPPGRYVQDAREILRDPERFAANTRLMQGLLERLAAA